MAAAGTSGYSGTPLVKKLGIKPGTCVLLIKPPPDYLDWLGALPDGVSFSQDLGPGVDLVQLFVSVQEDLEKHLCELRAQLHPAAAVWVSWPKQASRQPSTVTENSIRDAALPLGFVDIKVCSVSEVWSGLKLVVRKSLRHK